VNVSVNCFSTNESIVNDFSNVSRMYASATNVFSTDTFLRNASTVNVFSNVSRR